MMNWQRAILYLFLPFFFLNVAYATISYSVQFIGIKDKNPLKEMKEVSDLVQYKKKPPRSVNALRYRAQGDIPQFIEILHNHGYYDSTIKIDMEENRERIIVYVAISPGIRYKLQSYKVIDEKTEKPIEICKGISPSNLGIKLHEYSNAHDIVHARKILLANLAFCGYPLARITKYDVLVNTEKKEVDVDVFLDLGPLCHFGPTTITGSDKVKPEFIRKKIRWKEGEVYSTENVAETQACLLSTNLFSSVMLTHSGKLDENNLLPMKIATREANFKNLSIGVSYATIDGPGVDLTWANRNIAGMGQLLSLQASIAMRAHSGIITYMIPDVFRVDQNYIAQFQALRERIHVYRSLSYILGNRIDQIMNKYLSFSVGVEGEYVIVRKSINNGKYWLLGMPMYVKFTTTTDILNPSSGITAIYQPLPYYIVSPKDKFFFKQKLTSNFYVPLMKNKKFIFAWRFQLGSIVGAHLSSIPMTHLFFGGSDDDLRGYKYRTVSPRNRNGKFTGGRSVIYVSFEPRIRLTEKIGLVPFSDWGTLSQGTYPDPTKKWYKSVGIGLRYFTFFGPLRIDVGVPLDRRSLDPRFRVYVSIGQTF